MFLHSMNNNSYNVQLGMLEMIAPAFLIRELSGTLDETSRNICKYFIRGYLSFKSTKCLTQQYLS